MNKRRKFFSGYAIFCICWSILSLGLSIFSVVVRIFSNSNFNNVSNIKILPGINAGVFIVLSSIYFFVASILGRKENKRLGNMVFTSVIAAVLFICQALVVVLMYSIHKINLRIYLQAIISFPFLLVSLSIMMTEIPHMRHTITHNSGRRLFSTLDKITKKKDVSRIFKPRKAKKRN